VSPFTVVNNSTGDELIYAWSVLPTGSATIINVTSGTPTIVFNSQLTSGERTLKVMVSNSLCPAVDKSFTVYVNQAPTVNLMPIADDCETLTLTPLVTYNLTDSFISEFNWSFPGANPSTSTAANPANIVYSNPGDYTVNIMVGNECGEASVSQSFRLTDGLEPSFVVADSVCLGESFTVVNNSTGDDLTYAWSVVPAGSATISNATSGNPTIVFNGPLSSGEYTLNVTVSNSLCPSVSASYTVYVNQAPTVSLLPIADDCEILTLTPTVTYNLTENFISDFNWSFPGANPSTSTAANPMNILYANPGEYNVTIMVGNECGESSASQSFRLLDGPEPSLVVADSVCLGESFTVVNNSTGDDLIYAWTVVPAGSANISDTISGNPTIEFNGPLASGEYTLNVTVSNSLCPSVSASYTVYVNQAPTVSLLPIADNCETLTLTPTVTYNLSENFISSFNWSFPGSAPSSSTEAHPTNVVYSSPGEYTVTIIVGNECGEASASQSFRLLDSPEPSFVVADSVCVGEPVTIVNNSTGDELSYAWTAIPGIIDFSNPNIGNPDLNISEFTPSGFYQLQVVVSNPICGSNTSSFSLYVNRAPLVFLLSIPDDCFCESQPQPLDLQVTYSLDNNFISQVQWSIPGGDSSQLSEFWPQNVFIPEPGNHTVTVSVFNECGFYTDSTSFITYEKPMVNFDVDSIALLSGQSVNLTAGLSSNPDFSYLWSTGDTNPDITVNSPGIYVLTVFSSYCSPSTDTVIVYLASNLQHSLPPFTEIKVFPNPAKDIIVLSLTAAQTDIFPIRVFDSLGKSVYQAMLSLVEGQVERHEINSTLLSPGVYYLNVGNETLKLIIMP
jgi:PKD repeat protein